MPIILFEIGIRLAEYIYDNELDWIIPVLILIIIIILAMVCK
jgi:hypothetical protein